MTDDRKPMIECRGVHKHYGDYHALRGIDRAQGARVVVRPDQHVAHVLPLDATDELAAFFDGFLI